MKTYEDRVLGDDDLPVLYQYRYTIEFTDASERLTEWGFREMIHKFFHDHGMSIMQDQLVRIEEWGPYMGTFGNPPAEIQDGSLPPQMTFPRSDWIIEDDGDTLRMTRRKVGTE